MPLDSQAGLYRFANNAVSVIAQALRSNDTTIYLATDTGNIFPPLIEGQKFAATLVDPTGAIREIVTVTARNGDILTVERGQEDTPALPWPVGTLIKNLVTRDVLYSFTQRNEISVSAVVRTPKRTVVSDPLIAPLVLIEDIIANPNGSGTIVVKTFSVHNFETGDPVSMRPGGWNGITMRAHPAWGNWDKITVIDPNTFVIDNSVWVPNSVFLHGVVFRTGSDMIDSRPILSELFDYIRLDGGGTLSVPEAPMALLSSDDSSVALYLPENGRLVGRGYLWLGDNLNVHMLASNGTNNTFVGGGIVCNMNRAGQILPGGGTATGRHIIRYGAAAGESVSYGNVVDTATLQDATGYGIGLQGEAAQVGAQLRSLNVSGTYVDGIDYKNRLNKNQAGIVQNLIISNFALGRIGLNYLSTQLDPNPISTTLDSSIITVQSNGSDCAVGVAVTFKSMNAFNGINLNGLTFRVVSSNFNSYQLDISPQIATATSAGGGSSVEVYESSYLTKVGLDLRGVFVVDNIQVLSDMQARSGVRLRRGEAEDNHNGQGGWDSTVNNIVVVNTGPIRGGSAIAVVGEHNAVTGVTGVNLAVCIQLAQGGNNNSISGFATYNCNTAALIRGDGNSVTGGTATGGIQHFVIDGGTEGDPIPIPENGFQVYANSFRVRVEAPENTLSVSDTVTIRGSQRVNGVRFNGDRIVTAVDVDHQWFEFNSTTLSPSDATGGGADAFYYTVNKPHIATNNTFTGCKSKDVSDTHYFISNFATKATIIGCTIAGTGIDIVSRPTDTYCECNFASFRPYKYLVSGQTLEVGLDELSYTFIVPTGVSAYPTLKLPLAQDRMRGQKGPLVLVRSFGVIVNGNNKQICVGTAQNANVYVNSAGASLRINYVADTSDAAANNVWMAESAIGTWVAGTP